MSNPRTLILIPTYNERDNVERLCTEIVEMGIDSDILFLDDNSPDGTGAIIDRLAEEFPRVRTMHRTRKLGIGSAHLRGIAWAFENGYELLVTMDCDYSHKPEYLPDFINGSKECDVVIGTRFGASESLREWSPLRRTLTLLGHFLTRTMLRMKYDATGAFRAYRLDVIPQRLFDLVGASGYSFFFESLFILQANGFTIKEVPIELPARTYGHSKMRFRDALHSLSSLIKIFLENLVRPSKRRLAGPSPTPNEDQRAQDLAAWDVYWHEPASPVAGLYQRIARIYRKNFIKRNLNRIVGSHIPPASRVLHAGCGSGEVDTDIPGALSVTALDISGPALRTYDEIHDSSSYLVRGSVFQIPLRDDCMDGIFHLGLMEHFTEDEIHQVLMEFNRVLKAEGKMVVFWPPRFGLTVYALKAAHFLLKRVMRKDIRLHPDEITLLRSEGHATAMFEKAGFTVDNYYFGPRDLFTQSMIVVSKASSSTHDELGQRESTYVPQSTPLIAPRGGRAEE